MAELAKSTYIMSVLFWLLGYFFYICPCHCTVVCVGLREGCIIWAAILVLIVLHLLCGNRSLRSCKGPLLYSRMQLFRSAQRFLGPPWSHNSQSPGTYAIQPPMQVLQISQSYPKCLYIPGHFWAQKLAWLITKWVFRILPHSSKLLLCTGHWTLVNSCFFKAWFVHHMDSTRG